MPECNSLQGHNVFIKQSLTSNKFYFKKYIIIYFRTVKKACGYYYHDIDQPINTLIIVIIQVSLTLATNTKEQDY